MSAALLPAPVQPQAVGRSLPLSLPGPGDRVLVIAPHPDDEVLGAGALLRRALDAGAAVRVLVLTDGENNPWPQRVVERRWRIGPTAQAVWGERRRRESLAGLARLGIDPACAIFLGLPDGGVTRLLQSRGEALVADLAARLRRWEPTLVVAPWAGDAHPDHSAAAVLVRLALARAYPRRPRPRELSYAIHGSEVGRRVPAGGLELRMDAGEAAAKREAIACHGSQLVLSRRRFLAYARALEAFRPGGTPFRPGRFLRRLGFEPGELRLEVSVPAWWHLFGKPRLLVIAAGAESVRSFTLVPPLLRRRLALQASPQAEVLAHGSCRRAGGSLLELTVPVPALPRTETLFVKLQRAGLPRDACGWVEIPAAAPSRRRAPVLCLVPCYDVAPFCEPVLRDALARADAVVAVDDGSGDGTGALLDAMAAASGGRLQVLHFDRNRGKGAALRAGFLHVLERFRFDVLVTMDGDGQHRPADIPALVAAVRGGADMAIGERPVEGMPLRSRLGNTVMGRLVRRRHQRCPADTQSGLRAFTRAMVREIAAAVPGHRYETELRVLLLALVRGRRIASVPVPAIYIEGNRSSHFRPVLDSLRVLRVLFDLPARDGDSVPAPPAERV